MFEPQSLQADILIIGGGAAGCYAAITASSEDPEVRVIIAEKANIKRSGCLAAGVNALNAYINPGESAESYVEYVKKDSEGIVREDLVYTIAQRLNKVTRRIEELGLPILKDEAGNYVARGKRSIKINGENIKPLLAGAVGSLPNVTVLNRVNVIDYIVDKDRVVGAYAFSLNEGTFYAIYAKATICAAGGAAGLYKPNNPGFSRHKMWYCPFNTGAGYAMGIRAGAEMTGFEMRFIALRCKDTIAPTGTIAQGVKAPQVNGAGEEYVNRYGKPTTPLRLFSTVRENEAGRGPCYLKTEGISEAQEDDLYKAYLNMAPAQTLKWVEQGMGPRQENVEIEGTEPYVVGGHTGSGYWIDRKRATTLKGLFAAGDVAGGSPKKYVTGCFAEGEIAALSALEYGKDLGLSAVDREEIDKRVREISRFLGPEEGLHSVEAVEEGMQKVMDQYAGGISTGYLYNTKKLEIAGKRITELKEMSQNLRGRNPHQIMLILEILDRLEVCEVLIAHLKARQETRWPCYQSNADFPERDDQHWLKYVNSRKQAGRVEIILRALVQRDEEYEHQN